MSNQYSNLDEIVNMAMNGLKHNGIFVLEDFFNSNICQSVSEKVIDLIDNKIDN